MSAIHVPANATPKQAARRFAASFAKPGFKAEALHEYRTAEGAPIYWRLRGRQPDGEKVVRPFHLNGAGYVLREPAFDGLKPLYGLDRLAAAPKAPVLYVEGEHCADELQRIGLLAVTSGGATSDERADFEPLRGRHVILWPDFDTAGAEHANRVAAKLRGLGCTLERLDVAALGLPDKGDCVDWLLARPDATANDVLALQRAEPLPQSDWLEPLPLSRQPERAAPYPLAAIREACPLLADAIEDVATVAQADKSIAGAAVLSAAALVAQALHDVTIGGRRYPLSLYFVTVAASGERKSECDTQALRAVREFERVAQVEYRAELASREDKHAPKPMNPRRVEGDPTLEGLTRSFEDGCPSRLIACADGGLLTGGYGLSRDNRIKTAAGLTLLFDGAPIARTRSTTAEAVSYFGRRLSMHLAGQPAAIGAFVTDSVLRGQGLLARCLLAIPPILGMRRWESVAEDALPGLAAFRRWQTAHLSRPLPLGHAKDGTPTLELQPVPLGFAAEAQGLYAEAYNQTQAALRADGPLAPIREFGARIPEHVARLAGLFTAANGLEEVNVAAVRGALALVNWHAGEWLRAADAAGESAQASEAEQLFRWIAARGQPVTLREVYRNGPRFVRSAERARDLLEVLRDHRLARAVDDAYEANPRGLDGA